MTDEKWEQLVSLAKSNFKNVELTTEDLVVSTSDGPQVQGTQDVLIFDKDKDRFKLVRENRPVVLEKKMFYSHRAGDTARSEYKFSDTELSHKLKVYRDEGVDDWQEVTLDNIF